MSLQSRLNDLIAAIGADIKKRPQIVSYPTGSQPSAALYPDGTIFVEYAATSVTPPVVKTAAGDYASASVTTGTSVGIAKSAIPNIAIGDVLVAAVGFQSVAGAGATGPTLPSGWVLLTTPETTGLRLTALAAYAVTDATALAAIPTTITFGGAATSGRCAALIRRVTGAKLTLPSASGSFVGSGTATTGTTPIALPTVTTPSAGALLLGVAQAQYAASAAATVPVPADAGPFTAYDHVETGTVATSSQESLGLFWTSQAVAGPSGTKTVTWNGPASANAGSMAYLEAA